MIMLERFVTGIFVVTLETTLLVLAFMLVRWILSLIAKRRKGAVVGAKWLCICWLVIFVRLLIPCYLPSSPFALEAVPLSANDVISQSAQVDNAYGASPVTIIEPGSADVQNDELGSAAAELAPHGERTAQSSGLQASLERFSDKLRSKFYELGIDPLIMIGVILIAGTVITAALHIISYVIFSRSFVSRCRSADPDTAAFAHSIAAELGVKRRFSVLIARHRTSPVLFGLFHTRLILPERCEGEALELAIRHELIHLRRRDLWLKLIIAAALCLHWFNIILWLASSIAENDLERACDDELMRGCDRRTRRKYCDTILDMADNDSKNPPFGSTGFTGKKEALRMRFVNIMNPSARKNGLIIVAAVVLCCALVGTFGCAPESQPEVVSVSDTAPIAPERNAALDVRLPLNAFCTAAPLDFSAVPEQYHTDTSAVLSLSDALYCINYAHSCSNAESVYYTHCSFIEAQPVSAAVFSSGTPCAEWLANHYHPLPFHSTTEQFTDGAEQCPVWLIRMQDPNNEAPSIEEILVNALTGDIYNASACGGYMPSPYPLLSDYSAAISTYSRIDSPSADCALQILFDLSAESVTHITAAAKGGQLVCGDIVYGNYITLEPGQQIGWSPYGGADAAASASVDFNVYNGNKAVASGTIQFCGENGLYTARLITPDDLHLEPSGTVGRLFGTLPAAQAAATAPSYTAPTANHTSGYLSSATAMRLINEYRARNGLSALRTDSIPLETVAQMRLAEMGTAFSHQRPNGQSFSTAFAEAGIGYRQCVENLASGQSTAQQVVNAWTRSASHNANLLDPTICYMRVAVGVTPNGMPYWVFVAYG